MEFKFYHGTSSIFLDSIKETGLGTINPNTDLNLFDLLTFLNREIEKTISNNANYLQIQQTTLAMIDQTFLREEISPNKYRDLNFRHNNIHVSLSKERAITHVSLNKYGSEILGRCIDLYLILKQEKVKCEIPDEINTFKIENLLEEEPTPIIIEISNLNEKELLKDDGKTAIEALNFLRTKIPHMTEKQKFDFFQKCNFEVLQPIRPESLKFYELDFEGHPAEPNFEYYLNQI